MTMLIHYIWFVLPAKFFDVNTHFSSFQFRFWFVLLSNDINSAIDDGVWCECVSNVWMTNKVCWDASIPFHIIQGCYNITPSPSNICFIILFFSLWHSSTIGNCSNGGATTMDDEDPSNNGGATIVFISFSIIKWIHICGPPSSMILFHKIICKIEIRIDEKYNQYKQR